MRRAAAIFFVLFLQLLLPSASASHDGPPPPGTLTTLRSRDASYHVGPWGVVECANACDDRVLVGADGVGVHWCTEQACPTLYARPDGTLEMRGPLTPTAAPLGTVAGVGTHVTRRANGTAWHEVYACPLVACVAADSGASPNGVDTQYIVGSCGTIIGCLSPTSHVGADGADLVCHDDIGRVDCGIVVHAGPDAVAACAWALVARPCVGQPLAP